MYRQKPYELTEPSNLHEIKNRILRFGLCVQELFEGLVFWLLVEGVTGTVKLFHHRLNLGGVGEVSHAVLQHFGGVGVLCLKNEKKTSL